MRTATQTYQRPRGLWHRLLHFVAYGTDLPRSGRLALYLGIAFTTLSVIWVPVGLFLYFKPVSYTSTWTLILPGSGAGHAVSLDSVGQASATVSSPYQSHSVDPKVNYKAIVESEAVLAVAASSVGMSVKDFGKARIKLADQTALMDFRISGASAQQAYEKSVALYNALQNELERLRADELERRESAINDMLHGFGGKLHQAQQRIIDYQANAQVVSLEQFTELTMNLERMRDKVRDLQAQRAGLRGRLSALTAALGVEPSHAAALLDLQQDALFRELAAHWAEASALHTRNKARWGRKHQQVVSAREDEHQLHHALLARAEAVAPHLQLDVGRVVARGTSETALYQRLIELEAEHRGMQAQITTLEGSIAEQKLRLERSTKDASNLEDLKRKHQVATAVFSTALAKVDIGKSDRFSSYPLVQLLAAPSLPEKPDTLGKTLALIGGIAGTFFILLGLFLLWIRKPFIQKILKNA